MKKWKSMITGWTAILIIYVLSAWQFSYQTIGQNRNQNR